MARRITPLSVLFALLAQGGIASAEATASAKAYQEAVKSTMAENEKDGIWMPVANNIVCLLTPFDPVELKPRFVGGGSGDSETSANRLVVKATDAASLGASCSAFSVNGRYTLTVSYRFQYYRGSGLWKDLGTAPFSCSTESTLVAAFGIAQLQVPGSSGCQFQQIYQQGDPSIGRPHRLQVELTVVLDGKPDGPHIKGWSLPWPMLPTPVAA